MGGWGGPGPEPLDPSMTGHNHRGLTLSVGSRSEKTEAIFCTGAPAWSFTINFPSFNLNELQFSDEKPSSEHLFTKLW